MTLKDTLTQFDRDIVLASASPRRRELLAAAGVPFRVVQPSEHAECGSCSGESPAQFVARLATQKAIDVGQRLDSPALVIGCDTVALCRGQILGKPRDIDDARAMLEMLSGRPHEVLSGLCLLLVPERRMLVDVARTELRMDQLSPEQLEEYLESHAWEGKAGAFGYQDGLDWLTVTSGSESNVVGLPLELLEELAGGMLKGEE